MHTSKPSNQVGKGASMIQAYRKLSDYDVPSPFVTGAAVPSQPIISAVISALQTGRSASCSLAVLQPKRVAHRPHFWLQHCYQKEAGHQDADLPAHSAYIRAVLEADVAELRLRGGSADAVKGLERH